MNDQDYPALYQVADGASISAQKTFLCLSVGQAFLLVLGTSISFFGIESPLAQIVAAALLVVSLFVSFLAAYMKFERIWYRGRAIAESIKTMTWKYMMRAEPFSADASSSTDDARFLERLDAVLKEIPVLGTYLANKTAGSNQITAEMRRIRKLKLKDRAATYLAYRIREQKNWYKSKSIENRNRNIFFFWSLIVFQVLAVAFLICRAAKPDVKYWPIEVCIVIASSILTWIQIKKFEEHATAYSLAATEIGLIQESMGTPSKESVFSEFVNDSENAFSREHTQWAARRSKP